MDIKKGCCFMLAFVFFASCALGEPEQKPFNGVSITDDIRGAVCVSEIHWAGSVLIDGTYDKPDDNFIELYNGGLALRSLKGWAVRFKDESGKIVQTVTLPGGSIGFKERYTIGRDTRGAFSFFDHCEPGLRIPRSRFSVEVVDAGGRVSDTLDFTQRDYLPGSALPTERRSAVRWLNFFNEPEGNDYLSVFVCEPDTGAKTNIKPAYRASMHCGPGDHKQSQILD